ncbi:hypothetical protein QBL02_03670 [Leucobacter sp. UT-8R-CII-1-4]|uniref:hypothetical protein n=1 Tax=Leucobacter sp. UT-8R-CII-1-4 TaxID=3040075 RepID=UPI0024A8B3FC|nr:hypothetical protein [Leucobacter sp. UT-8R-CII-1-4]MDI6022638.1 hypothetical protein [Leucobacter sp. UT-8R-CII-1-4]
MMDRTRTAAPAAPVIPATAEPAPLAPINWWRLDAQERTEVMELLRAWVPELARRYSLPAKTVPPCWYRHESLIQELLALFQYRNQNQFLPTAPAVAAKEFHYEFQLAIHRLTSWHQCNESEHTPDRPQPWTLVDGEKASSWQQEVLVAIEAINFGGAPWDTATARNERTTNV